MHLAYQNASTTATAWLELIKGTRTRPEEEALATDLLLNLVAEACGIEERLEVALGPGEQLQAARAVAAARSKRPPGRPHSGRGRERRRASTGAEDRVSGGLSPLAPRAPANGKRGRTNIEGRNRL